MAEQLDLKLCREISAQKLVKERGNFIAMLQMQPALCGDLDVEIDTRSTPDFRPLPHPCDTVSYPPPRVSRII